MEIEIIEPCVTLESSTPDMENVIARACRVCYKSEANSTPESDSKLIKNCISRGHQSVLEHASMTFRIVTNRGVTHELVRHRIGCAYSQESTRYVNYQKKGIQFINPSIINPTSEEYDIIKKSWQEAADHYNELISKGAKPELARTVLPNGLKTEIVVTMDCRALRHFFELRCSKKSHPEIRFIAFAMLKICKEIASSVFGDMNYEF